MERRIVGGESPNRSRRWVLGREADRHPAQAVHEPSKIRRDWPTSTMPRSTPNCPKPPGWPKSTHPPNTTGNVSNFAFGRRSPRSGGSSRNRSEPRPHAAKQVQARQGQTGRLDGDDNRAGTDQAHKHGVLVLKTPSRAPLKCSTASFLPVREQRRGSGTTACSRDMPRQKLGDGLGCAAGGPFDGSRRTIAISQGQDRAAVGCTRLSVDTVERALDAYELLRR